MTFLRKLALFFTLVLLFALIPSLASAEQGNTVPDGDQENLHIQVPIEKVEDSNGDSSKDSSKESKVVAAAASNVGYVDVWVTKSPKKINWKVHVNPPYKGNGFNGWLSVTHLTQGSNQRYHITTMSGSLTPPIPTGTYGGRLEGTLTYNGSVTGVTLASGYLQWTN
ncbi:hypothetical protein ABKP09_04680 [Peribacillus frigoritolerans]|uniref:hypothetical protein n=1 Tax=Peribacillus frigoritolerans TaxID=450367 RepID=UPI0032B5EF7C